MVEKEYVSWDGAIDATMKIAEAIRGLQNADQIDTVDRVVGVVRGGLPMAVMLSHELDVPMSTLEATHYDDTERKDSVEVTDVAVNEIEVGETVLLVDDVVDTGRTLMEIKRVWDEYDSFSYATAVWHKKSHSAADPMISVDQTDRWIVYPWEEPRGISEAER